ncbi:MAG: nucleotidyl transferase AbiEii/AbiGii toxin family protein [Dehalococcoidia bacterium]
MLAAGNVPHAFGGATALAFHGIPRYTHDIDINIALPAGDHPRVLDCLASLFPLDDRARAERELMHIAQTRLRWRDVPIDLFFANTPYHDALAQRTHAVEYAGTRLPVVSAEDLIILKAAFNRGKDWLDIENVFRVQQQHLDVPYIRYWLATFSEPDDDRWSKIEGFSQTYQKAPGAE